MEDPAIVDAIYRLSQGEHWSIRKVARHLGISRVTSPLERDVGGL